MSTVQPERTVTPTPACGTYVSGSGPMSYPCTLPRSHRENGPEDDREPCYAMESAGSVRLWQAWRERQDARDREALSSVSPMIECPGCGDRTLALDYEAQQGECRSCGVKVPFQKDPEPEPTSEQAERANPEPIKQREGDQRLPDGGMDCVQDRVIADMEESKRVGIERYGDTLHTFNGRRGFVDIHDEVRDLFVYLTQMRMEAEADRETLVEVVKGAFKQERRRWLVEISNDPERWHDKTEQGPKAERLAEIAVDRIMGWVVGQQQGRRG